MQIKNDGIVERIGKNDKWYVKVRVEKGKYNIYTDFDKEPKVNNEYIVKGQVVLKGDSLN